MSRIFLSYARDDVVAARAVFVWLEGNGWEGDVFLDDHSEQGIAGGQAWRNALRTAADRCEAVIILITRSWLDSKMCWSEFEMAEGFRKPILPILLEGDLKYDDIPDRITNWYQLIDRAKTRDEDFDKRLQIALTQAGVGPESFSLPDDAHPYPGLGALTAHDAALFFGRDVEVMQTTQIMREIRATSRQRMLVILGSSGSGKSSLMRAGLWPRLNRDDRNFITLPVIRPSNAVLTGETGLWRALAQVLSDKRWARHLDQGTPRTNAAIALALKNGGPESLQVLFNALRLAAAKSQLKDGEAVPDIVILIDQAEELFSSEGSDQADHFLTLLRPLLVGNSRVVVVLTMRSDVIPRLQTDPRFVQEAIRLFNLPPMAATSLPQVITGPAERLGLTVDPLLTNALLADSRGADALPLLAFTLRELFDGRLDLDKMSLADYESIGGVRMAIQSTASKARAVTIASGVAADDYSDLLRRCFIPHLVRINESGQPARRVARLSAFDVDCLSTIDHLVDQRLLISGIDGAVTKIEIAHEAVLREWPEVESLVAHHRDFLAWREQVSRNMAEYQAGRGDLLIGRALAIALGFVEEFAPAIDPEIQEFVTASQDKAETERRALQVERDRVRQAELDAAQSRARDARRNTWRIGIFASIVSFLAIGLGVVMWQANRANAAAEREAQITESLRLAAQAQELVSQTSWPAGRAIAWLALPHDATMSDRPITSEAAAAIYHNATEVIFDEPNIHAATYAPSSPHLLLLSKDSGRVRVLNTVTRQVLIDRTLRGWTSWVDYAPYMENEYARPGSGGLRYPTFSSDGPFLSVVHGDNTAEVWRLADGSVVASALYEPTDLSVIFSHDMQHLLRTQANGQHTLVDLSVGNEVTSLNLQFGELDQAHEYSFGNGLIDSFFEDPTAIYLWVRIRDYKGFPSFIVYDRRTGEALRRFNHVGNDDVFVFDPEAGARVLICGFNNATTILNVEEALAPDLPPDPEIPTPGLKFAYPADDGFKFSPVTWADGDRDLQDNVSECATSEDNRRAIFTYGDQLALFDIVTGTIQDVTTRFPEFLPTALANRNSYILNESRVGTFGMSHDASVVYGIIGSPIQTGSRALVFHDLQSGELIARLEPSPRIDSYLVDRAAHTAVIETIDGAVSVWDVATGAILANVRNPSLEGDGFNFYNKENIQLEPSGNSLSITIEREADDTTSAETRTTVYRLRPDAHTLVRSDQSYRAGHILGQGAGVLLGTADGLIERRWLDGQLLAQEQVHDGAIVTISPASGAILTAGWDGVIAALNPTDLTVTARVQAHNTAVSALVVAPDGEQFASGSQDGTLALWPGGLGAEPLHIAGHEASVSQILFTEGGDTLVSSGHDGRILLHDVATGATLTEIVAGGPPIWDMVIVPDSDLIAASLGSGGVMAWNQPGAAAQSLRWSMELGSRVRTLVADPSGRYLAIGLEDGRVLLQNEPAADGTPGADQTMSLVGHRSAVVGLSFIGDGKLLASLSRDRTLRFWDIETERQVAVWEGAGTTPLALLAEFDGQNIAMLFDDNLVELRRLPRTTLREVIANVGQALTHSPPVPFALCDQLRVTGIPGSDRVCTPPN